ncbi:hypothetical protein HDU86_008242 [Geranomyces michiganensis]|nr:hypothetical protein HDU86_008242 [Geranomyces michiganensis]
MPAAVASPPAAVHGSEFVRACSGSSTGFRPIGSANGGNLSNSARHLPPRLTPTTPTTTTTSTTVPQTTQQPRPPSVPPHYPQQPASHLQAPPHSPRSAARISALERTIEYMQVQHSASLKGLHEEVAKLQSTCSDLSLELVKTKALLASSPLSHADDDALRDNNTFAIIANLSDTSTITSPTTTIGIAATSVPDSPRTALPPVTRVPHPPAGRGRGGITRRLLDSPSQSAAALAAEEILAAYVAAATGEASAGTAAMPSPSAKLVVLPPIRFDAVAADEEEAPERAL